MSALYRYLPDLISFLLLLVLAVVVDLILHQLGAASLSRHAGWAGALLLAISFLYSARKHRLTVRGSPRSLLRFHQAAAWLGALLIVVHGGTHFHALLPWLAQAAMIIVLASGLVGGVILRRATRELAERRSQLPAESETSEKMMTALHSEAIAVDVMKRWRTVHMPLSAVFLVLSAVHIASAVVFWRP